MSGNLLRIRRKRRLGAALRWAVARQPAVPAGALAPLSERLDAIAAQQQLAIPPDADLPERLARIEPGGAAPPEVVAMLAALLLPFLTPPARSTER
jgi:type III secretion system FlhB-like substrate exporter